MKQKLNDYNTYSFDKLTSHIKRLQTDFPFIELNTIGKSHLNKSIYELRIGKGSYTTHLNAGFHGNEWITTALLMKCIETYLFQIHEENEAAIRFYNNHRLSIVPLVNPDGVDLVLNGAVSAGEYKENVLEINQKNHDFSNWKANIKGIDLNKQFPALWKVEQDRQPRAPHFRDFPGYTPLTEPEAIAMEKLINHNDFKRIHAFHTQGEEIYWGFQGLEPIDSGRIVKLYEQASDYAAIRYVNNYAGFKDWFIQEFNRPGFTIEFGKGINPLPFSQFDKLYKAAWKIFVANLRYRN